MHETFAEYKRTLLDANFKEATRIDCDFRENLCKRFFALDESDTAELGRGARLLYKNARCALPRRCHIKRKKVP